MKNFVWVFLLPVVLSAQNNIKLDAYMQKQAGLYGFSGNVLIAKKGTVIYKKSFGYADRQVKRILNDNSIFDCGSIAKEFTAMGILLLKDKGLIDYNDTLGKFIPGLPYGGLTIQQLLTHTSGMPNGFAVVAKFFDHGKIASNEDLIQLLVREKPPLLFKPGENLMYSGTAFNLLASVIEKVSGQSYKTYMYEKVFTRLGMINTQVFNAPRTVSQIKELAYGYSFSDSLKNYVRSDSLETGWTSYLSGITGEGMIITTTNDLLKWDRSIHHHTLLRETTQREMLSVQGKRNAIPAVQFGYGMRVGDNDFGHYIFHDGFFPGYQSMHINYTNEDITAIVLSNNESAAEFIADALVGIVLKKDIRNASLHRQSNQTALPGNYTGKYMMRLVRPPYMTEFPVEFLNKHDSLFIHPTMGKDIFLKPETSSTFFFADGTDQQIEFERAGTGVKVWHIAWGLRKQLTSIP